MIMDFGRLVGKRVKILAVFSEEHNQPIFYECIIQGYEPQGKVLEITDKFDRRIFIDADSVKQVILI
jgi:hypothetical protein